MSGSLVVPHLCSTYYATAISNLYGTPMVAQHKKTLQNCGLYHGTTDKKERKE